MAGAVFNMIFLRFGKRWEPQKEEEVQRLQNQVFHIFLGPMGLGETLAIFFGVLGSDGKSNERHRKKLTTKVDLGLCFFFGRGLSIYRIFGFGISGPNRMAEFSEFC